MDPPRYPPEAHRAGQAAAERRARAPAQDPEGRDDPPPEPNLRTQQRRFDAFRDTYNRERPHEALAQQTPAALNRPAPRPYPERLPSIEYHGHFEVRKVSGNGGVRWRGRFLNITTVLLHEYVGFEEVDDGLWTVYYSTTEPGRLNERDLKITDLAGEDCRKPHQSRHRKYESELHL